MSVYLFCMLMITFFTLEAQQTIKANMAGNVRLTADKHRGDLQWQIPLDSESWKDTDPVATTSFTIEIMSHISFFRAEIVEEGSLLDYSEIISTVIDKSYRCRRPEVATRDAADKPIADQEVTIPSEISILLDESILPLSELIIGVRTEQDLQVMNIEYDDNLTAGVFIEIRSYSQKISLGEVINSGGEAQWQDGGKNRVWVKMQGETRQLSADTDPLSNAAFHEKATLQIITQ